jgi:hypothetical protein
MFGLETNEYAFQITTTLKKYETENKEKRGRGREIGRRGGGERRRRRER